MKSPDNAILDQLRAILGEQGTLPGDVRDLAPDTDLYAAGLTSLASVDLMLAIEQNFGVSFPDEALSRRTFSSIGSIAAVIERLTPQPKS
jgi:acyl carrier protein